MLAFAANLKKQTNLGGWPSAGCHVLLHRSTIWQLLLMVALGTVPYCLSGAQPIKRMETAIARGKKARSVVDSSTAVDRPTVASTAGESNDLSLDRLGPSIVTSAAYHQTVAPTAYGHEMESEACRDSCDLSMDSGLLDSGEMGLGGSGRRNYLFDWSRSDLWLGVTGFNNAASFLSQGRGSDAQVEGSFGYQEGFNFGSQVPSLLSGQVGAQIGMRFVQSNLDGTGISEDSRHQTFATVGLFRRVDYGLQGGLAVDYLRERWVITSDLWQLRGELSFLFSPGHELGFRFTDSPRVSRQTITIPASGTTTTAELEALDTVRLFGRRRFGSRAASTGELHLGTSDRGGTLLGCLIQQPLSGQVGLETAANYFMPGSPAVQSYTRESWNLSLALVWTPGRRFGTARDYNRPLFEVAGNGSLITASR